MANTELTTTQKLYLPILTMALTLFLMMAFHMTQLVKERDLLQKNFEAQQEPLEQTQKVSEQFQALVVGTAKLADEGNKNAKQVMTDLKAAGVNYEPKAEGAAAAPEAPAATPTPSTPEPAAE